MRYQPSINPGKTASLLIPKLYYSNCNIITESQIVKKVIILLQQLLPNTRFGSCFKLVTPANLILRQRQIKKNIDSEYYYM